MMTFDGLREVESPLPLCLDGPFFLRDDVLAMRREAAEVARETLAQAPQPVRAEARTMPTEDIVGELLRWLIERSR